jgi:hypothetical protein
MINCLTDVFLLRRRHLSQGMCDAIARAGNGAAVFVGEMEKPDQKLMSLIRASAGPPIEDLTIDWGVHEARDVTADASMQETISDPGSNVSSAPLSMFDEGYDLTRDMKHLGVRRTSGLQQYPPAALMSTLVPGARVSFFAIVARLPSSTTVERSRVVKLNATVQGQPLVLECPVSPITPACRLGYFISSRRGISYKDTRISTLLPKPVNGMSCDSVSSTVWPVHRHHSSRLMRLANPSRCLWTTCPISVVPLLCLSSLFRCPVAQPLCLSVPLPLSLSNLEDVSRDQRMPALQD